jgi:DNA-binding response OmpR family regulator
MSQSATKIVVIDHQAYWLGLSAEALTEEGFTIHIHSRYDYPPPEIADGETPDLVILGCPAIREEEQKLIESVLARDHHLLVLCTSLSMRTMRSLFLGGASDVTDKTFDPNRLVAVIKETLRRVKPETQTGETEELP